MEPAEKINFQKWLTSHTNLSDNVISDTTSRLARIEKIMPVQTDIPAEDFVFNLGKNPDFLKLKSSIKSQLKRSYKLYHDFKNK